MDFVSTLRTRDIDFLIPLPLRIREKIIIPDLLKDLGFLLDWRGAEGYMRLVHPELIVEFLVPGQGKGGSKPYPVKSLGINAQPLRFLNLLTEETIVVESEGITLRLPHPVNYAFQKLIIGHRRKNLDKRAKDQGQAVQALHAIAAKEERKIKETFGKLPPKWQQAITQSLTDAGEDKLRLVLER